MPRRYQQPRLRDTKRTNTFEIAIKNGLVPVRRPVSPKSYEDVENITNKIGQLAGRLIHVTPAEDTGVTIIPATRYTKKHHIRAPSIQKVADLGVRSSLKETNVIPRGLFIAGYGSIARLALGLEAPTIEKEKDLYEEYFASLNLVLKPSPNNKPFRPHLSIGTLRKIDIPEIREILEASALNEVASQTPIILAPVNTKHHER